MEGTLARIAWRSIFRNRRRSAVIVASVAVGVAGAIFMNVFMWGMAEQMVASTVNSFLGEIQIHRNGFADNPVVGLTMDAPRPAIAAVERLDGMVRGYAPRVLTRGLAESATNASGVQIIGVDAARESTLTSVARRIVDGTFLTGRSSPRRKEVVIGDALAGKLGVGVGRKIVLVAQATGGEMGSDAFRVIGIFRMPSEDLNRTLVWVDLADAQNMLGIDGGLSEVMVMLRHEGDLTAAQDALARALGPAYEVRTWREASKAMVVLIQLFDVSTLIMMAIVFFAATFGIANTMLMAVFERTREFGILRALGTRPGALFRMVIYEAAFIGALGIAGGMLIIAILYVAGLGKGLDLSIFAQSLALFGTDAVIRPRLRPGLFAVSLAMAEAMTVLASMWPALRAARLQPADAIRRQ